MTPVPIIPENAPFSPEQRAWLNGFLAGLLSQGGPRAPETAKEKPRLLIAYGSQSGNAESLAKRLGKEASGRGFAAQVAGLDSVLPAQLVEARNVLVVTSTWGEGDMPDNAASFWDKINQNGSSPKLDGVRFSVLALGDRNYGDTFCLAGRKLDERLAELGGVRLHSRVDCDVDFDEPAKRWSEGVWSALRNESAAPMVGLLENRDIPQSAVATVEEGSGYTRKKPFHAPLIANIRLSGERSNKDIRHIAFSLAGSGLAYETGDALGVFVQNCPSVVASILSAHQLDPNAGVALPDGGQAPLDEALLKHFEVRALLGKAPKKAVSPDEFVANLRRLQPRLYSIASSMKAHPGEAHLCVGAVRYERDGVAHKGVGSTFLTERLALGDTAGIYTHTAKHFRLPPDSHTPVIMAGPGTGIAPFRAFLEERQVMGATGRNWLFFGDQKRKHDFLYEEQILAWLKDGHLTRLDTAFSRDQEQKIYVQDRMLSAAGELWRWLDEGAHFYVCGDASRMAKDVDAALHAIIQQKGGKSADEAAAYVAEMKSSKRYARDVY